MSSDLLADEKAAHVLAAFSRQCEQNGDATALEHDAESLTYSELRAYVDAIAEQLLLRGIGPGDTVGLCLAHSVHAVAAMLAVMRANAVFVPLDPVNPPERTQYMVDDARISLVLCAETTKKVVGQVDTVVLPINRTTSDAHSVLRNPVFDPDALAYIMYTSGSTGRPKGVKISHRALDNYCKADADVYLLQATDRTLQFSSLGFDIAIEEIFPPLCTGGTVVMRPSKRADDQIELSEILRSNSISCLHIATGYWHEWVDLMAAFDQRIPTQLRLVVVTGEKVSVEHYRRWLSLADHDMLWVNAYGPTETTVTATTFIPTPDWSGENLPIGKPLPGYEALILKADGTQAEHGETGELCIGGPSLAEGYLNKPEQTAKAFVEHPFRPEEMLYRTGDLARWQSDGNIEYAGRIDHQLKIGSYRVEPGEIENAINTQPGVLESLVVQHESNGRKRLLAYVAHGEQSLDVDTVRTGLSAALPDYMVPQHYILLPRFEKTINGKVDRANLPDISQAVSPRREGYAAPTSDTERALQSIWQDVLDMPEVGIQDSFFALGGDSLTATQVIAKMKLQLGKTLSSRDFFYLETINMMAAQLDGKAAKRIVPPPVPAFIDTPTRQIYTVLQRPDPARDLGQGVLLVPPLGNEQRRIQRPMRGFMQHLARSGYTVLRFDWTGTADSSGDACTLHDTAVWQDDIVETATRLGRECEHIDIVSFRMGGLFAANTCLASVPVRQRIYCEPVLHGASWLNGQHALHTGILQDTYRFLKPRLTRNAGINEFSGLEMADPLLYAISKLSVKSAQFATQGQGATTAILNNSLEQQTDVGWNAVQTSDENKWFHPRTTNIDMHITHSARIIADLLQNPNDVSDTGTAGRQNAA